MLNCSLNVHCAVEEIKKVNRFLVNLRFFSWNTFAVWYTTFCHDSIVDRNDLWFAVSDIVLNLGQYFLVETWSQVLCAVFPSTFPFHNSSDIIGTIVVFFFPGDWIHMDFGLMSCRKPQIQGAEKSPVKLRNDSGPLQNRAFDETFCPGKHITNVHC